MDFNHCLAISKIIHKRPARIALIRCFILVLVFINASLAFAQITPENPSADTTLIQLNVLPPDTIATDTIPPDSNVYRSPIQTEVVLDARDSIDNDVVNKKVYLYGDAVVTYGTISLNAAYIEYDFATFTVTASGVQDSLGVWSGLPKFKDGANEFDGFTMQYNFKSKKAFVRQVFTEVIEGTLTGKDVKMVQGGDVIYVRKGEYCPCEDPNAKTRIKVGKLKLIKNDKIVTGPGYLALHGVPTPLVFPFGYFPNTDKKQAGIIIPGYGNGQEQGYFLSNLGFYLPINEYVDNKILADIYSRGSWALRDQVTYKRNYKYTGNLDAQYLVRKLGDKELLNYSEDRSFFVTWRHIQDIKAKPNSNFSADLSVGSSATFRNNLNANQDDFLTNTFRSNITYQKRFYDSPWSFNVNAGHDQNSNSAGDQGAVYNFTIPEITINRTRTFPLAGLFNNGTKQRFYEKIGLTYGSAFQNRLTANESEISLNNLDNLMKDFRNGARHTVGLSTSLKAGPVTINPSFSYNERWYYSTLSRTFDPDLQSYVQDTIIGFDRNNNWNAGVSATTKVYGMYSFRTGRIKAIRHTLTPSVGYSVSPNFDARVYGFYGADGSLGSYSPYDGAVYSGPPSGASSLITFSLVNNLEAKMLSRRDTANKFVKVPIIENIQANGTYNLAADSLKLSTISLSGRTKLTKYANINARAVFDPYSYVAVQNSSGTDASIARVDRYLYNSTGKLASFENGTVAVNASGLSNAMFKRQPGASTATTEGMDENGKPLEGPDAKGGGKFSIPWNATFGYALGVRKVRESIMLAEGFGIIDTLAITQSIQVTGGLEFFKKVKVNINSGYDFETKELTPTTLFFIVDLNCWEFNARVVPFGTRKSFNLSLFIKSSMLRDLKLEMNRNLGGDQNFFF